MYCLALKPTVQLDLIVMYHMKMIFIGWSLSVSTRNLYLNLDIQPQLKIVVVIIKGQKSTIPSLGIHLIHCIHSNLLFFSFLGFLLNIQNTSSFWVLLFLPGYGFFLVPAYSVVQKCFELKKMVKCEFAVVAKRYS